MNDILNSDQVIYAGAHIICIYTGRYVEESIEFIPTMIMHIYIYIHTYTYTYIYIMCV